MQPTRGYRAPALRTVQPVTIDPHEPKAAHQLKNEWAPDADRRSADRQAAAATPTGPDDTRAALEYASLSPTEDAQERLRSLLAEVREDLPLHPNDEEALVAIEDQLCAAGGSIDAAYQLGVLIGGPSFNILLVDRLADRLADLYVAMREDGRSPHNNLANFYLGQLEPSDSKSPSAQKAADWRSGHLCSRAVNVQAWTARPQTMRVKLEALESCSKQAKERLADLTERLAPKLSLRACSYLGNRPAFQVRRMMAAALAQKDGSRFAALWLGVVDQLLGLTGGAQGARRVEIAAGEGKKFVRQLVELLETRDAADRRSLAWCAGMALGARCQQLPEPLAERDVDSWLPQLMAETWWKENGQGAHETVVHEIARGYHLVGWRGGPPRVVETCLPSDGLTDLRRAYRTLVPALADFPGNPDWLASEMLEPTERIEMLFEWVRRPLDSVGLSYFASAREQFCKQLLPARVQEGAPATRAEAKHGRPAPAPRSPADDELYTRARASLSARPELNPRDRQELAAIVTDILLFYDGLADQASRASSQLGACPSRPELNWLVRREKDYWWQVAEEGQPIARFLGTDMLKAIDLGLNEMLRKLDKASAKHMPAARTESTQNTTRSDPSRAGGSVTYDEQVARHFASLDRKTRLGVDPPPSQSEAAHGRSSEDRKAKAGVAPGEPPAEPTASDRIQSPLGDGSLSRTENARKSLRVVLDEIDEMTPLDPDQKEALGILTDHLCTEDYLPVAGHQLGLLLGGARMDTNLGEFLLDRLADLHIAMLEEGRSPQDLLASFLRGLLSPIDAMDPDANQATDQQRAALFKSAVEAHAWISRPQSMMLQLQAMVAGPQRVEQWRAERRLKADTEGLAALLPVRTCNFLANNSVVDSRWVLEQALDRKEDSRFAALLLGTIDWMVGRTSGAQTTHVERLSMRASSDLVDQLVELLGMRAPANQRSLAWCAGMALRAECEGRRPTLQAQAALSAFPQLIEETWWDQDASNAQKTLAHEIARGHHLLDWRSGQPRLIEAYLPPDGLADLRRAYRTLILALPDFPGNPRWLASPVLEPADRIQVLIEWASMPQDAVGRDYIGSGREQFCEQLLLVAEAEKAAQAKRPDSKHGYRSPDAQSLTPSEAPTREPTRTSVPLQLNPHENPDSRSATDKLVQFYDGFIQQLSSASRDLAARPSRSEVEALLKRERGHWTQAQAAKQPPPIVQLLGVDKLQIINRLLVEALPPIHKRPSEPTPAARPAAIESLSSRSTAIGPPG